MRFAYGNLQHWKDVVESKNLNVFGKNVIQFIKGLCSEMWTGKCSKTHFVCNSYDGKVQIDLQQ